jgi:hypothetical protein
MTMLLTPFGIPFDLSVVVGVVLSTAAVLLSRREARSAPHADTRWTTETVGSEEES